MSAKKNRQSPRQTRPGFEPKPTVGVPKRSNWQFPLIVVLILFPGLGLWGYLRWIGQNLTEEAARKPEVSVAATKPELQSVKTAQPSWNRPCDNGTGCWVTESDQLKEWNEIDNPASDGWDTEVFTNVAMKQFEKLKKVLLHTGPFDNSAIEFIVDKNAIVGPLLPTNLDTTYDDSIVRVNRMKNTAVASLDVDSESPQGSAGLARSLRALMASFSDLEKSRMKIKVFRVEKQPDSIKTLQTVEIFGPTQAGVQEVNSIWEINWTTDIENPVITNITATEFETAIAVGKTLFSECTESVLGQTSSFQNQLLRGYDHWLERSQFQRFSNLMGTPGVAVGDVNSDGLDDIYLCQEGGLPNLLFLQKSDGSLEDFSKQSGTDWLQNSRTALIVDLNNDGHKDLAVGVDGGVVLAQGDGTGKFIRRTVLDSADDVLAIAAADYDLDGRLDLYVGVYYPNEFSGQSEEEAIVTPGFLYYDAKTGGPNSLFHNEIAGDHWTFDDVTGATGLNELNSRYTMAAAWEDFDNDGDQDLYVANDFAPNNMFRNDLKPDMTRGFVDIAHEASAEDVGSGMSVAWSDFNRDGWMDLYVSNMFSYAGNRIMYQTQFKSDADESTKQNFRRLARGNTLLKNLGKSDATQIQNFEDRSLEAAVNRGRWAWGSAFVDINNDGWDDLVVANGYITTEGTGDL